MIAALVRRYGESFNDLGYGPTLFTIAHTITAVGTVNEKGARQ
jgi:hypothetical protein